MRRRIRLAQAGQYLARLDFGINTAPHSEQRFTSSRSLFRKQVMDNVYVRQDPAGNIKMDKEKSTEKIDATVATVMALDRAIRNQGSEGSVYDGRGILVF